MVAFEVTGYTTRRVTVYLIRVDCEYLICGVFLGFPMSAEPFVFLHACDFRLDEPVLLPGPIPELLRDRIVEAPYRAAENVFRQAIAEDVDFLVLCGDLLDPRRTGPRGPAFLCEWFSRLGDQGIAVFWNAGRSDAADHWPGRFSWPENVHRFQANRPELVVHSRRGKPLARLVACRGNRRRVAQMLAKLREEPELHAVALCYGKPPSQLLRTSHVRYWALGGIGRRLGRTLRSGVRLHSPGLPQPRAAGDRSTHGATLVRVDDSGAVELVAVATAVVCRLRQCVAARPGTTLTGLGPLLHEHLRGIAGQSQMELSLVNWVVACDESLAGQLRDRQAVEQLLEMLWERSAVETPTVWSVGIAPQCDTVSVEAAGDDRSLRGEFLRQAAQVLSAEEAFDLTAYLPEAIGGSPLAELAQLSSQEARRRVLDEARALGAALLTGEEPEP